MIDVCVGSHDYNGASPLSQLPRRADSRPNFETYQQAVREEPVVL
jgi:hypothetical protein